MATSLRLALWVGSALVLDGLGPSWQQLLQLGLDSGPAVQWARLSARSLLVPLQRGGLLQRPSGPWFGPLLLPWSTKWWPRWWCGSIAVGLIPPSH